ncbi:hypothetical protein HY572_06335 [Candidatus Micrarchaeota archaeon]|nr:hypothetical protein [Candidatus Micrarchaeota archaeon]
MKIILAGVLLVGLILAGCVQQVQTPSSDKLTKYASETAGFSIKYPQGWNVVENPDEVFAVFIESYGERMAVAAHDNSGEKLSLKELVSTYAAGTKEEMARQQAGKISVVFDGPTAINGYTAHAIVLEQDGETGFKEKAVVIQSKKNPGKIFLVVIFAYKNTFTQNSAAYETIFQSFQEN